jgi:hypothetical protein
MPLQGYQGMYRDWDKVGTPGYSKAVKCWHESYPPLSIKLMIKPKGSRLSIHRYILAYLCKYIHMYIHKQHLTYIARHQNWPKLGFVFENITSGNPVSTWWLWGGGTQCLRLQSSSSSKERKGKWCARSRIWKKVYHLVQSIRKPVMEFATSSTLLGFTRNLVDFISLLGIYGTKAIPQTTFPRTTFTLTTFPWNHPKQCFPKRLSPNNVSLNNVFRPNLT